MSKNRDSNNMKCIKIIHTMGLFFLFALFFSIVDVAYADFIGQKGHRLDAPQNVQGSCDYWYQAFTVGSSSPFIMYFTSEYNADAAILSSESELQKFIGCQSFSAVGNFLFDNQYGISGSATLSPGTYYVGFRNQANVENHVSLELEEGFPKIDNATFEDIYIKKIFMVEPRKKVTHTFTVQEGFRYAFEGCNSGSMDVYVIPETETSNFLDSKVFKYYTDYSEEDDPNSPGLMTLDLPPGKYALAYQNNHADITQSIVYHLYRYRTNPTNSGGGGGSSGSGSGSGGGSSGSSIELEGSAQYEVSGSNVQFSIDTITSYRNGGTSGTLYLELWAKTSQTSSSYYTLASVRMDQLKGGYHRNNVDYTTSFSRPPDGSYYISMNIVEYPHLNTPLSSIQFSNIMTIGNTGGGGTVNQNTDSDGDGIADSLDNCPNTYNTSQADFDRDDLGNLCDSDDDNDGVPDSSDAFPLDATESVDTDHDGIGNKADTDDDNDGVPDSSDAFPLDATESVDTDHDGIGNKADTDDDGDNVPDAQDAFPLDASKSVNTDGNRTNNKTMTVNAGTSQALSEVAYADGLYMAVGGEGTIVTSSDGISWTQKTSGTTESLSAVAYGDGVWSVGGSWYPTPQTLLVSFDDGLTWSDTSAPDHYGITSILYNEDSFVAVTFQGFVMISYDGYQWQELANSTGSTLLDLAFANNLYVASGYLGKLGTASFPSGPWQTQTPSTHTFGGATYGNGTWVMVAGDQTSGSNTGQGEIWTSTHGTGGWEQISYPNKTPLADVLFANGQFLAVGRAGTLLTSTDGMHWQLENSGVNENLNGIAHDGSKFIVVGANGIILFVGPSGTLPTQKNEIPSASDETKPGDVSPAVVPDGNVDVNDAVEVLRMVLGIRTDKPKEADVSPFGKPDGKVDVNDAVVILQRVLGIVSEITVDGNAL